MWIYFIGDRNLVIRVLISLLFCFMSIGTVSAIPLDHCLGNWEWVVVEGRGFWRAPFKPNLLGLVDLRSIPQHAEGIPEGYGLFVYDKIMSEDGLTCFGGLNDILTPQQKEDVSRLLNVPLDGNTLLDLVWDALTNKADPTGVTNVKPLMPTRKGDLNFHLGGHSLVRTEKFNPVKHSFVVEVEQENYRKIRERVLLGRYPEDFHRRYLTVLSEKYKLDYKEFIPSDLEDEKPLPHNTITADDFNRPDEDLAVGNWTKLQGDFDIVTNKCDVTSLDAGEASAENDTTLATADHYVEANINSTNEFTGKKICVAHRIADNDNMYIGCEDSLGGQSIETRIAGTDTEIADGGDPWTDGELLRFEVEGSDLILFVEGSEDASVTNTDITGNLNVGIYCDGTNGSFRWDNWEAGDLGVVEPPAVVGQKRFWMRSKR